MEDDGVVPDVIAKAPNEVLKVVYANNAVVNNGAELTPTQVFDQPKIEFSGKPNKLYTLIMSDPDAPSRADPQFREILHWLVVNIPGGDINKGETIADYIGSGPPQGSGLHRYVFLVFEQPGTLNADEYRTPKTSRKNRVAFKTMAFATKHNLGDPIAGNFYNAQYDECVLKLRAQLKD